MKAVVIRGEQGDLDEVSRIARSVGSEIYRERGNKIRVLGYAPVLLANGEIVKVVVVGCKSDPGRGDKTVM